MGEFASIANFIYNAYVVPAFMSGREEVTIRVHEVLRGLESRFGLVAIHRVLSSEKFRASLSLAGHIDQPMASSDSHLPSEYVFDLRPLLSQDSMHPSRQATRAEIKGSVKSRPGNNSSRDLNEGPPTRR